MVDRVNEVVAGQPTDSGFRHRLRLLAACLGLFGIAFSTAPEQLIFETKLDMPVNPLGFLSRSLELWTEAHFGHIQNQAYGYLFPMGPFYILGTEAGLPPWVVQRLWMGIVLSVAFLGTVQLARAFGVGSPTTRILAGLAYALAPHAQALIGVNSSEFLPSAILPWMLIPLVYGTRDGANPRRAAALSALAFLMCGGINATAELAVLVVPLIYLLTRKKGPRRRRLLGWWLACTAAVSVWWLVPLAIMGRFTFSFMPYTENAATTTGVTSLTNTLRGAANWVGYLPIDGLPWWPAAYEHSVRPWLVIVSAAVAGLGLVGLLRRGMRERTFLVVLALTGVVIMVSGHVSVIANPLAPDIRDLFDGPLSAFRNIHKFDALVRLPISLGLAYLPVSSIPRLRVPIAAVATVLLAVTFLPVATVGLAARGSFQEIPGYWREAAQWLNANTGQSTVLAVPGSRWGEYLWGRPMDEPMQPLLQVRWATRTIVPWGSAGMTRLLDAVDERFATGQGSAGLTAVLARIGVRYLLVRNDLDRYTIRGAWPPRVHEAIAESPGLRLVKTFGPVVGDPETANASSWFNQPYPALEIYEVADAAPAVGTVSAERPLRVTGGPESLLALADLGLLDGERPVLLGDDPGAAEVPIGDTVVTDTLRRREVAFSELRFAGSQTLAEDEEFRRPAAEHDLRDPGWSDYTSVARFEGVESVTASSSAADITALPENRDTSHHPFAALDGDRRTSWRSDGWHGAVGEWLEVRFTEKITVPQVAVAFAQFVGPAVTEVEVRNAAGQTVRHPVQPTTDVQLVPVPPGPTDSLRLTVTRVAWRPKSLLGNRVGITEFGIPLVQASRTIAVPGVGRPGAQIPAYVLTGTAGSAPGCMQGSFIWTCSPQLQLRGEEGYGFDRTITSPGRAERVAEGKAILSDPGSADRATTFPNLYPQVTASSTLVDHAATLGRAAFDDDPSTIWYAGAFDAKPTLTIDFGKRTSVDRIKVVYPALLIKPTPMQVLVWGDKAVRGGYLDEDGNFRFKKMTARKLVLQFLPSPRQAVHIADLEIPGVRPVSVPGDFPVRTMCGAGPALQINGTTVATRIVGGTVADMLSGRPLTFRTCEKWRLVTGDNRFAVSPRDAYRIVSMVIRSPEPVEPQPVTSGPVWVDGWASGERVLRVDPKGRSYLVVNENHNEGWEAFAGDTRLAPARLDGWRQAWILPETAKGEVVLRYRPEGAYRAAIMAGGALILLVVLLAWRPGRFGRFRYCPPAPPADFPRRLAPVAAAAVGIWVGGLFGLIVVLGSYTLIRGMRQAARRNPDVPESFRRWATLLYSPLLVGVLLSLAGLSVGLGHYFAGTEQDTLSEPLRDVVAQLLCLPLLGRLAVSLRDGPEVDRLAAGGQDEAQPGTADDSPAPPGDERAAVPAVPVPG